MSEEECIEEKVCRLFQMTKWHRLFVVTRCADNLNAFALFFSKKKVAFHDLQRADSQPQHYSWKASLCDACQSQAAPETIYKEETGTASVFAGNLQEELGHNIKTAVLLWQRSPNIPSVCYRQ